MILYKDHEQIMCVVSQDGSQDDEQNNTETKIHLVIGNWSE